MGDVYCQKCGEPYDTYHMRYDEIWETDLREKLKEVFPGKLSLMYRKAFEALGWKFGKSIYNIKQCPCCKGKTEEKVDDFKSAVADEIEDMLGDDYDAIQTEMEDLK
jgi:hypothetical protein